MISENLWTTIGVQALYQDFLMSPANVAEDDFNNRERFVRLLAMLPPDALELVASAIVAHIGWRAERGGWVQ